MSKTEAIKDHKSTAIAVLHDARTELRTAADSSVELVEKLAGSVFRFARKLNARIDQSSSEMLDGVERALVNSRKAREARREAKREAKAAKQRTDKAA